VTAGFLWTASRILSRWKPLWWNTCTSLSARRPVKFARYVARLVEDRSTLQVGLGRVPNQMLSHLTNRRGLAIHSDVITEPVAGEAQLQLRNTAGSAGRDPPHVPFVLAAVGTGKRQPRPRPRREEALSQHAVRPAHITATHSPEQQSIHVWASSVKTLAWPNPRPSRFDCLSRQIQPGVSRRAEDIGERFESPLRHEPAADTPAAPRPWSQFWSQFTHVRHRSPAATLIVFPQAADGGGRR
jgi:hypothetical protein